MSHELKEGVKLKSVSINIDEFYQIGEHSWNAKSIVVSEQIGQMSMVPWAKIETNDGQKILVNLANVQSVILEDVDPTCSQSNN